MRQSILFRVDAAIAGALFRTISKNWKDTVTILGLGAFFFGALVNYSASVSDTIKFFTVLASGGALGFGAVYFAQSRVRQHSEGSPFALDSLDQTNSRLYVLLWGLLSFVAVVALGAVIALSAIPAAVGVWFASSVVGFLADRSAERSKLFRNDGSLVRQHSIRRYAGFAVLALAVVGILFEAVADRNAEESTILIVVANVVACALLTPVRPDEVRFFRIMGSGYARRCLDMLKPLLVGLALQLALIALLLRDVSLLSMVALAFLAIVTYRIVQIGLLRFLHPRAAELSLAFGLLALLMLGFSFPPLIAVFLAVTIVAVGFRAWRANWLIQ